MLQKRYLLKQLTKTVLNSELQGKKVLQITYHNKKIYESGQIIHHLGDDVTVQWSKRGQQKYSYRAHEKYLSIVIQNAQNNPDFVK